MIEHVHTVTPILAIAPLAIAAIVGAMMGAAKHYMADVPAEEADRKLAAETARYSPWTGMKPGQIKRANGVGTITQGAATGALLGSSLGAGTPAAAATTPEAGTTSMGPFSWGMMGKATGDNNWENPGYRR